MKTKFLLLLATLFLSTHAMHAQGSAFTYQGRLSDTNGAANGSFDLQLKLRNAPISGGQVGSTIALAPVTVSNGLFAVTLDFGSAAFDGCARWLEIGVRTNGSAAAYEILSPAQPLTATPYAVRAANFSGAVSDAQLPANVARLNSNLVFSGAVQFTNPASQFNGSFSGNGAGVTNVNLPTVNSEGAIRWRTHYGNFVIASSPAVTAEPHAVTAADVNGDGKTDLISVNYHGSAPQAGTLLVLTNDGKANFVLSGTFAVGNAPDAVTAADVNGDGRVDLISANSGSSPNYLGTLSVLTNNGSGGFVAASTLAVGSQPTAVAAADVNGDGRIDLVSANYRADTLSVLTNTGSGFMLASTLTVGSLPHGVVAADVNGDGRLDLVSAHSSPSMLTVLTNNGSGGFLVASTLAGGTFCVAAADVNGDGNIDLISGSHPAVLNVFTNGGSGNFAFSSSLIVGSSPVSVVAADVNADGKVDLVSANSGEYPGFMGTLWVLTNNGMGGFVLASSPSVGLAPNSVVAADVNGDNRLDLISANLFAGTLSVLTNTPAYQASFVGNGTGLTSLNAAELTGSVPSATLTSVPAGSLTGTIADSRLSANVALLNANQTFSGANNFNNPANSFVGNFSGNGAGVANVNLLTANSQGAISWTATFPGNFVPDYYEDGVEVGTGPFSVAAADVNGDGKMDIISANFGSENTDGNTLSVLTNNGSGRLVLASSPGVGNRPYLVIAADINGDAKVDLISANKGPFGFGPYTLSLLTNDGTGGFVFAATLGVGSLSVAAADVNGDGKVDLVSANLFTNMLSVFTNNGSGIFALASSPVVGSSSGSIAAADVNGDGKADLISGNVNNTLTVLTNNGSGGFVLSSSPGVGINPSSVTAADVNGDGKSDLISANYNDNTLTVLTNNGSGGFLLSSSPGVGINPSSVIAADVNADSKVDLVTANFFANTLTVLTNNGSGGFVLCSSPSVGELPASVVAADLNGDGHLDLISADGYDTLTVLFNTPTYQAPASFTGNGAGLTHLSADSITGGLTTNIVMLVPGGGTAVLCFTNGIWRAVK